MRQTKRHSRQRNVGRGPGQSMYEFFKETFFLARKKKTDYCGLIASLSAAGDILYTLKKKFFLRNSEFSFFRHLNRRLSTFICTGDPTYSPYFSYDLFKKRVPWWVTTNTVPVITHSLFFTVTGFLEKYCNDVCLIIFERYFN